jgi:aryl-alcohol dehydrogenase-like predicted oxidoreductase
MVGTLTMVRVCSLPLMETNTRAENTFACMKAAYDVGINFFDCAEGYSGGESERVMGQAIKRYGWKRNDLVISTKVDRHTVSSRLSINRLRRSIGAQPMATMKSTMLDSQENTLSKE